MGPFCVDSVVTRTVFHISSAFPVVILVTFLLSCFISTSCQVYDYLLRPDVLHLRLIVFPQLVYSRRVLRSVVPSCATSSLPWWFLVFVIMFLVCFQPFLLFITNLFHLLIWIPLPVGLIVSVSAQFKKKKTTHELLSCLLGGSIETSFKK